MPERFAWKPLRRPLDEDARAELTRSVRALLRFQSTLQGWRPVRCAPDATPFVSLYARGRLCGCYGSDEGSPGERLTRAFLRAAHDGRFAAPSAEERRDLAAQVSYPLRPRRIEPDSALEAIEVGTHGVALMRRHGQPLNLLPQVARDGRLGPGEFLVALLRKAGLDDSVLRQGSLHTFETEDVVVRTSNDAASPKAVGVDAAAAWLARLVDVDGAVTFAIDPRARRRQATGEMHHGRSAVVVQALAAHGKHGALVARAKRRLERDIRAALGGQAIEGWPQDQDLVAGTLALAVLAGVPLAGELEAFVRRQHEPRAPWHAAQVVAAIGARAPETVWATCVADLERHPFAPWTVLAASARDDRAVGLRAARGVADGLRKVGPHRGGAAINAVPQTAVTALAVEALARYPAQWARAAAARGRGFLRGQQLTGGRVTAALDPTLCHGAFSASPVVDLLRCDVTGHALLALL